MKAPQKHSWAAKILAMAPGEAMIVPDPTRSLDRAIVTTRLRSPSLVDVKFRVTRCSYIEEDRILPGIRIDRVA